MFLVLIIGCSSGVVDDEIPKQPTQELPIVGDGQVVVSEEKPIAESPADLIATCASFCEVDKVAYCEEKRIVMINDIEVVGTCRAFSRKENVEGFEKCEGFCHEYGPGVACEVSGQEDKECDGII